MGVEFYIHIFGDDEGVGLFGDVVFDALFLQRVFVGSQTAKDAQQLVDVGILRAERELAVHHGLVT